MADIVWSGTVDDGTWLAQVVRTAEYEGRLTVTRVSDNEVILDELVGLSYMALFGPDVSDVVEWQDKAIEAIDNVSG